LVKTIHFKNPSYVGDPINTVRIFNEKEVDELIFLDICATIERRRPAFTILSEIASECFMPVAYGGGIRSLEDIRTILNFGIEKVAINTYAMENPEFIREAADVFGSQSIVVSIDVKKDGFSRYKIHTSSKKNIGELDPVQQAAKAEQLGAGEILLTSVERDGTMEGYDIELIGKVSCAVGIPVIACGGAGKISDFAEAVKIGGASAVAAGSMFVYQGRNRAVLINFPIRKELEEVLSEP
jgi:cyclase